MSLTKKKKKNLSKKNIPRTQTTRLASFGSIFVIANPACYVEGPALAFGGRRWVLWALRGPALAFRGLLWAYVGLRWPSLGAVGLRWPSLAVVGCCGPSLTCVGLRWPSWACVGLC